MLRKNSKQYYYIKEALKLPKIDTLRNFLLASGLYFWELYISMIPQIFYWISSTCKIIIIKKHGRTMQDKGYTCFTQIQSTPH